MDTYDRAWKFYKEHWNSGRTEFVQDLAKVIWEAQNDALKEPSAVPEAFVPNNFFRWSY